jgi:hypothetical protein
MGVYFHCGEKEFSCSYSTWHRIRTDILHLTLEYLEKIFRNNIKLDKEDENATYHFHKEKIKSIIKFINENKKTTLGENNYDLINFLDICKSDLYCIDSLIYFGAGGIFVLCHKMDCEGYYSSGNSLDICELFELIKETVKNSKKTNLYDAMYKKEFNIFSTCLYDLFNESVTKRIKVNIL